MWWKLRHRALLALLLLAELLQAQPLWRAPRNGDTVLMGRPLLLQWQAPPMCNASLWYSLDTGRQWHPLLLDSATESFRWNVPALDTVAMLLRLRLDCGASPEPIRERRGAHQAPIRCVRFSPDGAYLVTTAEEGVVKVWNVRTLEATDVLVVGTPSSVVNSAAFVQDSSRILIAVDSMLLLYDRVRGQRTLFGAGVHRGSIRQLAVAPSGRYAATVGVDSLVCLWDLEARQRLWCWSHPGVTSWYSVAFSPDGEFLAYGGNDGMVYLRPWQQPWQPAQQMGQHGDSMGNRVVWSIAFGPEPMQLVSGGVDRTVRFWDRTTGREHARGSGHRFHVRSVDALFGGRRAVSGALDSTIRQWTPSGTPLGPVLIHGGGVLSVAYSPDGTLIASAGRDSALRLWESGVAQSREDTVRVVLKYPVRLRLPSLAGAAGQSATLALLHEDYRWIPPLRSDSFACRILLRLPAWLLERTPTPVVGSWDTVQVETYLRAADTLAAFPVRYLQGIPSRAPLELLGVVWQGTQAFVAEPTAGSLSVEGPCPEAGVAVGIAPPAQVRLRWDDDILRLELQADEDGPYTFRLVDATGREVLRQQLHLRHGEYVFQWRLPETATGLYWLQLRTPSRQRVQPLWHRR
jgi:WD40 repeat protein